MASYDAHKNFAYSTVATRPSPAASGTSLIVFAGDGTNFPAVPFNATIWPANTQPTTANAEIVRVTNISSDTFTITRAQESSSARTVLVGDQIAATVTVKTLTDLEVSTGLDITSPILRTSLLTPAAGLFYGCCGGRLTLTSGNPVPDDVTGASTVYFTPYSKSPFCGNIGLYDGSANWTILPFSEISVALGTLTSGLPYDVFAYNNSGVVALRAPVAWTNTTTRATALVLQNGVYVKSGATTDRYLGTFYTDSTTTTSDSGAGAAASGRHLYNYYNREPRSVSRFETNASWNYASATVHQANGSTANQVQVMIGVSEGSIELTLTGGGLSSNTDSGISIGFGVDVTNAFSGAVPNAGLATANYNSVLTAKYSAKPAAGHHIYAWCEARPTGTGTITFQGVAAGTSQSGITGTVEM